MQWCAVPSFQGIRGSLYKCSVCFLPPWLKDFVHAKGKIISQVWAELCWKQENTDGRGVQAWTSPGTLTVLAGESGTVPLCFVCVPKNTFENASINFFSQRGTLSVIFFSWKSSASPIWTCSEVWSLKTCIFQRICWKQQKKIKEEGPSLMTLMTKPFVYKNFSQMTQEFTVNVFGSDHRTIQIGIYVYVTQSFNSCFRDFLWSASIRTKNQ